MKLSGGHTGGGQGQQRERERNEDRGRRKQGKRGGMVGEKRDERREGHGVKSIKIYYVYNKTHALLVCHNMSIIMCN